MLPVLVLLAASPRVLVVSAYGEVPGAEGKPPKWSAAAFTPLVCSSPDAGLSSAPDCLASAPASATVTMLDGSTQTWEPFKMKPSQLTVLAAAIEIQKK